MFDLRKIQNDFLYDIGGGYTYMQVYCTRSAVPADDHQFVQEINGRYTDRSVRN